MDSSTASVKGMIQCLLGPGVTSMDSSTTSVKGMIRMSEEARERSKHVGNILMPK